ncbi:LysR substrate-binding domain-containing protein, partial [Cognatishimia activa]
IQGLGVAYTPRFALGDYLEEARLLPLLTEYSGEASELGAVYLEGRTLPNKVRALIDFVADDIRTTNIL